MSLQCLGCFLPGTTFYPVYCAFSRCKWGCSFLSLHSQPAFLVSSMHWHARVLLEKEEGKSLPSPQCLPSVWCWSLSCVQLFLTSWTVAYQASLSMGFPRQEYWSGLPFPFSRGSSQPRDWTWIFFIAGDSLPSEPPGKRFLFIWNSKHIHNACL